MIRIQPLSGQNSIQNSRNVINTNFRTIRDEINSMDSDIESMNTRIDDIINKIRTIATNVGSVTDGEFLLLPVHGATSLPTGSTGTLIFVEDVGATGTVAFNNGDTWHNMTDNSAL